MEKEKEKEIQIPPSYTTLPFTQIKVTHVPETSTTTATPVVLLTLNRPAKNNAFTETMKRELVTAYGMFDVDERVRCVVVTGAGHMFCAGADLEIGFPGSGARKTGGGGGGDNNNKGDGDGEGDDDTATTRNRKRDTDQDHRDGGGQAVLAIHHCRKPTIMAVNGSAVGIGATLQLPAAIRVAYSGSKIGFVFSRRGLVMEACSSYFLPRLIGFSRALHLTTMGRTYPPSDPLLFPHLYSEVLPTPEATVSRALELADDVARNTSILSSYLMREMMWRDAGSAEAQHLLDSRIIHGLFGGRDNEEGIRSFLEKRSPDFRGNLRDDAPSYYPWWSQIDVAAAPKAKKKGMKVAGSSSKL